MKYKYNGQWVDINIKALDGMPIGSIILFAGETIPTGWLICDGDTLNEEEYPELFDVIRYKYGGSGQDFNLPNFKGRVGVGLDSTQTEFDTLGETGGYKGLQKHTHQTIELGGNTMTSWSSSGSGGIFDLSTLFKSNQFNNNQVNTGDVNGAATVNGAPSTSTAGNLQPYLVVNYIIKATNTTPTMASVVNAQSDSTVDTYSCDYVNNLVIGNHDNSDIGFVKLPGGIAICYGRYWPQNAITVPASSGSYFDITLPITMVAQQYIVIISKFAGGNGYASVMDAPTNFTATGFTINLWNNAGAQAQVVGYDWVAIGKYQ